MKCIGLSDAWLMVALLSIACGRRDIPTGLMALLALVFCVVTWVRP